jgi:hypothetical protein
MGGHLSRLRLPGEFSGLRLDDLRAEDRNAAKLMNVRIPEAAARGIARVARDTGRTKTDVVIALLNEGLATWAEVRCGWTAPSTPTRNRRRRPTGRVRQTRPRTSTRDQTDRRRGR